MTVNSFGSCCPPSSRERPSFVREYHVPAGLPGSASRRANLTVIHDVAHQVAGREVGPGAIGRTAN